MRSHSPRWGRGFLRSGHTGKATLQPGEGRAGLGGGSSEGLRVTVTLSTDTGVRNRARVHDVTCAEYRNIRSYSEQLGTVVRRRFSSSVGSER